MSYVYRITFPQQQEMVAYALTFLGVREIRNTAEKMGTVLFGAS